MPEVAVIIPAAGRGERMGAGVPKQYRPLGDRSVLWHTLARFHDCPQVEQIVVAIHPDDEALYATVADAAFDKLRPPVFGGPLRSESVRAGLQAATGMELILVHDAVRPWVSQVLIDRIIAAADEHGAAIPVLPVTETIKVIDDDRVVDSPDRSRLYGAQTPQGFRRSLLESAFQSTAADRIPTDEALLLEQAGIPVFVVEGEPRNVKITTPSDLPSAALSRVGIGYDVHALADGRPLVLGGVRIEATRGLAGHSDADVLTHAIIDALLGAARLGDIGQLFPDDDPAYAGISSLTLLQRVRERLREAGAQVINIDAVVMAQAPRLAPHADAMAAALAQALAVDAGRISVKATTTERLGFVGRQEGIAAQAVALLEV